jgi:hypothetical protein
MRKQTNTLSPSPKGFQSPKFSDSDLSSNVVVLKCKWHGLAHCFVLCFLSNVLTNKTEKSFSNLAASQFFFSRSNKSTTTLQFGFFQGCVARLRDCCVARLRDCSVARLRYCCVARLRDCCVARLRYCCVARLRVDLLYLRVLCDNFKIETWLQ